MILSGEGDDMAQYKKVTFPGANGADLAARLDLPSTPARGYALFAHCFTCSKDTLAAARISAKLAELGLGVLRFDFTGLGQSGGDFSNTNFSSNVEDLLAAVKWMESQSMSPSLLVGHSLGGAAVITAASQLPQIKAVATLGAPSEPGHLEVSLASSTCQIEKDGEAEVDLAGRQFLIKKQFLDDIRQERVQKAAASLGRPLLIMHAPLDATVSIDNATQIFVAAKHPKSFVSLDQADHLLNRREDAEYAASVIASWATPYVAPEDDYHPTPETIEEAVAVAETGWSRYQNWVVSGPHRFLADEPRSLGGEDTGPGPFKMVMAGLGACTTITLRMYAERKNWPLEQASVEVTQDKSEDGAVMFRRNIRLNGDLTEEQRNRMMEIADKCPVHRMLTAGAVVISTEST